VLAERKPTQCQPILRSFSENNLWEKPIPRQAARFAQ
jgi:hypothetical protein